MDIVVAAAFDRFGRSVRHLVEALEVFRHLDVEFVSLGEQVDTGSPLGRAILTIIDTIARLQRSLVAERVRPELLRARADGKRLGCPRRRVDGRDLDGVRRSGLPVREGVISPAPSTRREATRRATRS